MPFIREPIRTGETTGNASRMQLDEIQTRLQQVRADIERPNRLMIRLRKSNCGTLETNLGQKLLDAVSFTTGNPRRSWHGLVAPQDGSMLRFDRPGDTLANMRRPAGIDLISKSGSVRISATAEKR